MVRRYEDGGSQGLETKLIHNAKSSVGGFAIELTRRDLAGAVLSREAKPWDNYDARTRPWYLGASERLGTYWTEVYPFFTGQAAGVTASIPLVTADGTVRAVIGADVTLANISRFLGSLTIGKTGLAVIIDDRGRLIAHPRAQLVQRGEGGQVRLSTVDDLDDPVMQRAFDRYRVEQHGRREFTLDGRRYISSVSSLRSLVQREWSILVVVPEDDFVGFVVDNVRDTLVIGLSIIALAAVLAGVLIRQGLRADRDAMRVVDREGRLDAEADGVWQARGWPVLAF